MPRSNTPSVLQLSTGLTGLFKGLYAFGKAIHTIGKVFTALLPLILVLKLFGTILKILEFIFKPFEILNFKNSKDTQEFRLVKDLDKNIGDRRLENKKTNRPDQQLYCRGPTAAHEQAGRSHRHITRPTTTTTTRTRTKGVKETEIWYVITIVLFS